MPFINNATINEGRIHRFWFNVGETRTNTVISEDSVTNVVDEDKSLSRSATLSTGEQVILSPVVEYSLEAEGAATFTYVSDNPTKIDVDIAGNVVFQVAPEETASANITVTASINNKQVIRVIPITLTVSGGTTVDFIIGGVEGSARKALTDVIENATSGADVNTQQNLYTTQDGSTDTFVRNPSFFLNSTHSQALTCASPYNTRDGVRRAGTAVTPRHIITAKHYPLAVGDDIKFVATDNTVVTRTIVQVANVSQQNAPLLPPDLQVCLLDSDLPSSITPCKVFPSNYKTYLPSSSVTPTSTEAYRVPLLALDQQEKGLIFEIGKEDNDFVTLFSPPPLATNTRPFWERAISGDSGNPLFAVLGTELLLVTVFYSGGAGSSVFTLIPEINSTISSLDAAQGVSTGYTLTEADFSSFTVY